MGTRSSNGQIADSHTIVSRNTDSWWCKFVFSCYLSSRFSKNFIIHNHYSVNLRKSINQPPPPPHTAHESDKITGTAFV